MTETLRAGFIGVGNMGGAMAQRLSELGWTVGVPRRRAAPRGRVRAWRRRAHATPAALAAAYPVVVVAVVDAAQCDAVLFGDGGLASVPASLRLLRRPLPDARAAEPSHRARLGERGIGCIDAPMSAARRARATAA
jgi:3-hydroxyisobutyrate dehydrogenase-like beta-hydroxyacid dehydrogenase